MRNLLDISKEIVLLEKKLEESSGEITPEIEKMQEVLCKTLPEKIDSICYAHAQGVASIDLIDGEIKKFQATKKRLLLQQDGFDEFFKTCMERMGALEAIGTVKKISLPKPRDVVDVFDESKISARFVKVKTTTTIDRAGIKDILKSGETVDGARLVAGKQSITYGNITKAQKKEIQHDERK